MCPQIFLLHLQLALKVYFLGLNRVMPSLTSNFATPWSLPGSSVHEIFQAGIPEWVVISFFRGHSRPMGQTSISWFSCIGRLIFFFYHCTTRDGSTKSACRASTRFLPPPNLQNLLHWSDLTPNKEAKLLLGTNDVSNHLNSIFLLTQGLHLALVSIQLRKLWFYKTKHLSVKDNSQPIITGLQNTTEQPQNFIFL